jgi:hypothetical protein
MAALVWLIADRGRIKKAQFKAQKQKKAEKSVPYNSEKLFPLPSLH